MGWSTQNDIFPYSAPIFSGFGFGFSDSAHCAVRQPSRRQSTVSHCNDAAHFSTGYKVQFTAQFHRALFELELQMENKTLAE